jgi:hypothetical protein
MPNCRIYSSAKDIIGLNVLGVVWFLAGFITAIPGTYIPTGSNHPES